MGRVAIALVWHEFLERSRDRWVVVVTLLFALLASAVSLYGSSAEAGAATLTGPSLVTLASLLVPLVAVVLGQDAIVGERERNTLGLLLSLPVSSLEVVVAKYLGRFLAMSVAVAAGIGAAIVASGRGQGAVLAALMGPTILLGACFLALGVLLSTLVERQATATSLVIAVWFVLAFFYDLGLLGLLILMDGQLAQETVAWLTYCNPAGLFRVQMMELFAGQAFLEGLGMTAALPTAGHSRALWAGWIVGPVALSAVLLSLRRGR